MPETAKPCDTCYGYGLWGMGESSPMGPIDAADGYPTYPCPEFGANANPLPTAMPETAKTPETLRALADEMARLPLHLDVSPYDDTPRSEKLHADAWQNERQMRQEYFLEVIRLDDVARTLEAELEAAKAREEALRPYLQHMPGCDSLWSTRKTSEPEPVCSCGLDAASEPPGEEGTP